MAGREKEMQLAKAIAMEKDGRCLLITFLNRQGKED